MFWMIICKSILGYPKEQRWERALPKKKRHQMKAGKNAVTDASLERLSHPCKFSPGAQLIFNFKKAIVFGDAVRAGKRAGFDLTG